MAIGNRFRISDAQTYLGQGCLNVYHYKAESGTNLNAANCLGAWKTVVKDTILALQVPNVTHITYTAINLDDPTDFAIEFPTTDNIGTLTGDHPLASFVAVSFIFIRATRAVRNGWKRIVGIDEAVTEGNGLLGSYVTTCNTAAAAMGLTAFFAGGFYRPVIVRKNIIPALSLDFPMDHVALKGLTTQNTRKVGHGS